MGKVGAPAFPYCVDLRFAVSSTSAGNPAGRLSLVDLACGNGRFERFLAEEISPVVLEALAVDSCVELAGAGGLEGPGAGGLEGLGTRLDPALQNGSVVGRSLVEFRQLDIIERLCSGASLAAELDNPRADAAVSFGFFHHIPSMDLRKRALAQLVELVRPGGVVIVSLWCFLQDERLAAKARSVLDEARASLGNPELEPGDAFLGWKETAGVWRYCHSFTDKEADALAASVADCADEVARFTADGKSGKLNIYLALRKH